MKKYVTIIKADGNLYISEIDSEFLKNHGGVFYTYHKSLNYLYFEPEQIHDTLEDAEEYCNMWLRNLPYIIKNVI